MDSDIILFPLPPHPQHPDLAIFDFDGTFVKPKEGRPFPKDINDWQYTRSSVPTIIAEYAKHYHIVIVTDQSKEWKVEQIKRVIEDLNLTNKATVIIGVKTQKPSTALFNQAFPNLSLQNSDSFYVGDAAGRPGDWSDRDKQFAGALNIPFHVPEDIFPLTQQNAAKITPAAIQEAIIMVGFPASGKSTIANTIFKEAGYCIVNGDEYKTPAKMKKVATDALKAGRSVVFDSTAGTAEKRKEFIECAKKYTNAVRIIWVQTPIDISMERNKARAQQGSANIPAVAFHVYKKHFAPPHPSEGAEIITI
jgi:bifunctional polynucleotide phosphatase/kinase